MKRPEDMTEQEFSDECQNNPEFERDRCRDVFNIMHGLEHTMDAKLRVVDRSTRNAENERTANKIKMQATVACALLNLDPTDSIIRMFKMGYVQGATDEFVHCARAYQKATSAPIFKD